MPEVDFYFDFACPRSYLAAARLCEATLRTNSRIVWKPFDSFSNNQLLSALEMGLERGDAAAAWRRADLQTWADYAGLKIALPAEWPRPTVPALHGAVHAAGHARCAAYVLRVFAQCYGGGGCPGPEALADLAGEAGMDRAAFTAALTDAATAGRLAANAQELLSRGGFRSATMFVGEQMFCGNSRVPLVEFALGQASGRRFVVPGQHG